MLDQVRVVNVFTCDGGRLEPREEVVHSTLHHESEVAFALLDSIVQLFKIFVNPSLTSHTHNRYAWWAAVRLQLRLDVRQQGLVGLSAAQPLEL